MEIYRLETDQYIDLKAITAISEISSGFHDAGYCKYFYIHCKLHQNPIRVEFAEPRKFPVNVISEDGLGEKVKACRNNLLKAWKELI